MRRMSIVFFLFAGSGLSAAEAESGGSNPPIEGIGPAGPIVRLHTGFQFTEGPAADDAGNLFFTDVRANKIHQVDADGKLSTFLDDSEGCNGLYFDPDGRLIACQGGAGRVIAIDPKTKKITPLAEQYDGKRFNRPNDLVVDRNGAVYFTDPSFGGQPTQDKQGVYYLAKDGFCMRVIDDLPRPNGVLLTNLQNKLFVVPSGQPEVMVYTLDIPGNLGEGQVFCKLSGKEGVPPRGGDGLTIDSRDNLYVTNPARSEIEVFSSKGERLGAIAIPEPPSNCTFGGKDLKTLYVTARTSLYAVPMQANARRPRRSR